MIIEFAVRRVIKYIELILVSTLYVFLAFLFIDAVNIQNFRNLNLIFLPVALYILLLTVYYYYKLTSNYDNYCYGEVPLFISGICTVCDKVKTQYTIHCDTCNRCYFMRDHHCPWIGRCISAYNFKEFYMFLALFASFLLVRPLICNFDLSFLSRYILGLICCLLAYVNLLLCYEVNGKVFRKHLYLKNLKRKVFGNRWSNIKYLIIPMIEVKGRIVD